MNGMIFVIIIIITFCNNCSCTSATSITKNEFTNMSKYGSDAIVLGGRNYLYRIFMNDLEKNVETDIGPRPYFPICYDLENDQSEKKKCNSYIKSLLIINNKILQHDEIIIYTNLSHGSCNKRNVTTLELLAGYSDMSGHREPVVANDKSATTLAILAPGQSTDGNTPSKVMYVGASWTNTVLRVIRDIVPAFSSRKTENFSFSGSDLVHKVG